MDPGNNEQTELLRAIWNEMKDLGRNLGGRIDQTNARLDQTNARLEQTNERLDGLREDVNRRFDEVNERLDRHEGILLRHGEILIRHEEILIRHETAIGAVVREVSELGGRIDNFLTGVHRQAHEELDARLRRVEERLGIA